MRSSWSYSINSKSSWLLSVLLCEALAMNLGLWSLTSTWFKMNASSFINSLIKRISVSICVLLTSLSDYSLLLLASSSSSRSYLPVVSASMTTPLISLGVSIVSSSYRISTASFDLNAFYMSCSALPFFGHLFKTVRTLLLRPYISTLPNFALSRVILNCLEFFSSLTLNSKHCANPEFEVTLHIITGRLPLTHW